MGDIVHPTIIHITIIQAVLLGLLQGLTEFLPVSSTAHMAIAPQLFFHMGDPGAAFSAVVQLGPIVAIIIYFRNDLIRYVQGIIRTKTPMQAQATNDTDGKLGWYTLIGSIPILILGKLLEKHIDTTFRRLDVIAVALILLALVLAMAERVGKRTVALNQLTLKESLIIGLAQVLALVPGASRSGVTITAGLFQGLDRESAARFSFLLSIPAITAAGLYKLYKVVKHTGLGADAGTYVLAAIVAGVVAYIVIYLFLGYMKEHSTGIFIGYRIALGIALLVMLKYHVLQNHYTTEASLPMAHHIRTARQAAVPTGGRMASAPTENARRKNLL